MSATLLPSRWPDGPLICSATNLPAFSSKAELNAFCRSPMVEIWECKECGQWHGWTHAHAPAGESSGGAREYRMPKWVREMIDRTKKEAAA